MTRSGQKPRAKSRPKTGDRKKPGARPQQGAPRGKKSAGPSRGKSAPAKRTSAKRGPARSKPMFTKWQDRRCADASGKPYKRFFQLDTLESGVDALLGSRDPGILRSVHAMLGPADIARLTFEVARENEYALTFQVRAANTRRKTGSIGFVVPKNDKECAAALKAELTHLRQLQHRAGDGVLRLEHEGVVFLPDKHHTAASQGRKLIVCTTAWPRSAKPLGVHRNHQFLLEGPKPHTLTKAETAGLKRRLLTLIVQCYDPVTRNGLDLRDFRLEDVLARPIGRKGMLPILAHCRKMKRNLAPARLVHDLASLRCGHDRTEMAAMPEEPDDFLEAMRRGADRKLVDVWVAQYLGHVERGRYESPSLEFIEGLRKLVLI